jgi:AcrR family transcriptional regulator
MRESTDLRTIIVQNAGALFKAHGYEATPIKQIAAASGCTTAALYYYYPGGKAEILRAVIQAFSAEVVELVVPLEGDDTLETFLQRFGRTVMERMPQMLDRLGWLKPLIAQLSPEDRAAMIRPPVALLNAIHSAIMRFIPDDDRAWHVAWIVFCAYGGYGHMVLEMNLVQQSHLPPDTFIHVLAEIVGRESI